MTVKLKGPVERDIENFKILSLHRTDTQLLCHQQL